MNSRGATSVNTINYYRLSGDAPHGGSRRGRFAAGPPGANTLARRETMKGRLLGKTRSALMLLMFATAQTHVSAFAQSACPPPPLPPAPGQHPTLLTSYAKQPPWKVAGIDYAVGVPSTTTLTDWQLLSGPGITVNTTAMPPLVRVDDTSNVVISGVDFSLHGGATLRFINSPNPTVTNSNFGGPNLTKMPAAVIVADSNSPGLTVSYNTIDGGGNGSGSSLVTVLGAGTTTLTYNWLKHSPQHFLEEAQSTPVSIAVIYKYNLIEQGAMSPGTHLNFLQFGGAVATSVDVEYNTTYQTPQPQLNSLTGEGYQFSGFLPGNSVQNVTFAYNTMIATGGPPGSAQSAMVHGGGSQNAAVAHDNYIDKTAAWFWFYPNSYIGWKFSNNYNMVTGALISPP
jgi:hypothetical protein